MGIAVLQSADFVQSTGDTSNMYVAVYYNSVNGAENGRASVETDGSTDTVLSDNGNELDHPNMSHKWLGGKTDGFVVSVNSGNKVCLSFSSDLGLTKLRFLQGDESATVAFITTFAGDLVDEKICVM